MALFSFGKKTKAHVLPTRMAALLGAAAGAELVVEASEEGIAAIATAEQELADVQAHVDGLEAAAATHSTELAAAQQAAAKQAAADATTIATLTARVEELGKKPASNHTTVVKKTDALEAGAQPKGLLDDEIAEAAAEYQRKDAMLERARKAGILK